MHLISEGKNVNKAVTACAREYSSFVWGLATKRYDDVKGPDTAISVSERDMCVLR